MGAGYMNCYTPSNVACLQNVIGGPMSNLVCSAPVRLAIADASSVRNRVFQWLAYLDRIGGEL